MPILALEKVGGFDGASARFRDLMRKDLLGLCALLRGFLEILLHGIKLSLVRA
jgi:hypothetical protein